jgi:hypothetical protein
MQAVTVRVFEAGRDEPLRVLTTDGLGRFTTPLPAGRYRVEVAAPSFTTVNREVTLGARSDPIEIVLDLEPVEVEVDVAPGDELGADASASLTSTRLTGDDLLDLPSHEEDLVRHLLMLAGADMTGDLEADVLANFVIDGLEDNRLPRPDQIAQIIIDPASLSADGRGRPRIEIVTRPGTGRWRRSVDFGFADESLDARRPGEGRKEARQTRDVEIAVEGPVIPNVLATSIEVSTRSDDQAGNSLHAITPSGEIFSGVVQPERELEVQVDAQLQLNARHRLDTRVTYETGRSSNASVGGFTLPERGSDERNTDWSFRLSERLLSQGLTNTIRFEVAHESAREVPVRAGYAIDVADAFQAGGGTNRSRVDELRVRLDDDLRWERAGWNLRWGGRIEYQKRRSIDEDNFNGTFDFASLYDYCRATGFAGRNCDETRQIVGDALALGLTPVYLDAQGREVDILGVPTTFTQAFGNSRVAFSELAFDTHVQADRRFNRTSSLRLGLQYEGTNHSRDYLRLNPTANFQYEPVEGTVLGLGARLNFDDFTDYERLLRNDGSTYETELAISSPTFPDPFLGGTVEVGAETASRWVLGPGYRSPVRFEPQVSLTQEVPGDIRVTLSYVANFGYRQRRARNVNAPFPGTPLPDEILELPREERQDAIDRMRPLYPHVGNITQIETNGRVEGRTVRLQVRPGGNLDLFGMSVSGNVTYTYRSEQDDNDFNNPYAAEWGPSRRDHAVQSQFRIALPTEAGFTNPVLRAIARATYQGTSFNFNLRAQTGRLYSIQSGSDLNGDQVSRDRPIGVARNTEVGPGTRNLDMTFTKEYRLGDAVTGGGGRGGGERGRQGQGQVQGQGPGPGQGQGQGRNRGAGADGRRLRLQVRVSNLLNHTQPRAYGSVVTSPLFGLPTGYVGGRTVELSTSVAF